MSTDYENQSGIYQEQILYYTGKIHVLDKLEKEKFIGQGSHRSKLVHIYDKGLNHVKLMLKKYGIEDCN